MIKNGGIHRETNEITDAHCRGGGGQNKPQPGAKFFSGVGYHTRLSVVFIVFVGRSTQAVINVLQCVGVTGCNSGDMPLVKQNLGPLGGADTINFAMACRTVVPSSTNCAIGRFALGAWLLYNLAHKTEKPGISPHYSWDSQA